MARPLSHAQNSGGILSYCGEWTLVKHFDTHVQGSTLKCRRWTCEECAPIRKRQVIALALAGKPDRMLTLTVNPAVGKDPMERRYELARAWRLLCKRAQRKYSYKRIPCFVVVEKTEAGEPHFHVLLRGTWLDQAWISTVMSELTSSPICHIVKIDRSTRAAWYCAKYLGKDPQPFGTTKRYWCSQDWRLDRSKERLWDWQRRCTVEIIKASIGIAAHLLPAHCFTVQWISPTEFCALTRPP